ncbi:MAG: ribonucleoside-diphosphate reductase subunit alpha [Verrucomicrobiales bacterium]|nr:ribonucleoside-diphosphate reductase subunit alpha [Verrucomicrobiales bacterium]
MIARNTIEEDIHLKELARQDAQNKPRFDWTSSAPASGSQRGVPVEFNGLQQTFTHADVERMIGDALTDLMLARQEQDIFNDKNRRLVAGLAEAVTRELGSRTGQGERPALSHRDVTRLIERALVQQNAYDVARSFVASHAQGCHQPLANQLGGASGNEACARVPLRPLCRIIRRNGDVVPWDENKIEIAVRKAFLSEHLDSAPAEEIARSLTKQLRETGQQLINIEDLQDRVQEELMKQGHYKVAAAYILYRAHRAEVRAKTEEDARLDALNRQDHMILVTEEDGTSTLWDGQDLRRRIEFARIGLDLCLSCDQIETDLRRSLFPEMTREDLNTTVILNSKTLIERDADFARFAGRILLTYIYEEVLGWSMVKDGIEALPEFHRRAFRVNLQRGVEIQRLNPALLELNLDRLALALDPTADMEFDYLGIQTLFDRYLLVDKTGRRHRRLETPQLFFLRVAMGLFLKEQKEHQTDHIISLYNLFKSRRFCSSTPTLFNSGTLHSQLSSCYLYQVDDSIESIMLRGIAENAFLSKWAGGLGGSWTAVRGTGSYIKGTNGESQGVIPFLKLHNDQLVAVNQGGKRRGSGCAYLEVWHNDIFDFLHLRRNTGDERRRTHDMSTAVWVPDLFMKRMIARQPWTLFRSNEAPELHETYGRSFERKYEECEARAARGEIWSRQIPALDLWKEMLKMLFETGHPWITFKDPCNVRSPQDHTGVIHSSNLCTEITLNTSAEETAVCNLGSIILENHLDENGNIDHEKLRATIRVAVRALDNVIDINFYPTEAARRANLRHRPVGLGVMGLANALYIRDVPFASNEAVAFNDEIMEAVAYYAYEASSDLAAERGAYSTFKGSKWDRGLLPQDTLELLERERGVPVDVPRGGKLDWAPLREKIRRQGMRNSNVLAIAPTATISNIMGSTPCIEPAFKNLFAKSNLSGEFTVLNSFLVKDLKARGLWNQNMLDRLKYFDGELKEIEEIPDDLKVKYRTAFGIEPTWIIQAAGCRQKWIDQSQSVNLWFDSKDMGALSRMYREAWSRGLKTTYYLRNVSASNIEKATVAVTKEVRHLGINAAAEAPLRTQPEPTAEEIQACSLRARREGIECEACQ